MKPSVAFLFRFGESCFSTCFAQSLRMQVGIGRGRAGAMPACTFALHASLGCVFCIRRRFLLARLGYEMRQTHNANAVIAPCPSAAVPTHPDGKKPVPSRNNVPRRCRSNASINRTFAKPDPKFYDSIYFIGSFITRPLLRIKLIAPESLHFHATLFHEILTGTVLARVKKKIPNLIAMHDSLLSHLTIILINILVDTAVVLRFDHSSRAILYVNTIPSSSA